MAWTDTEWDAFCALVDEAWPGSFSDEAAESWRVLLDGLEPSAAIEALRRLLYAGHRFRPSASELLAEARRDPSRPTFAEAYRLLFEKGGALCKVHVNGVFETPAHMRHAEHMAINLRLARMHPLIAAFVERQGIERLRSLPLDHETWGEKARRDLEAQWNEHVETFDGREVAALASGRREELGKLDPLRSLGMKRPELPSGSAA